MKACAGVLRFADALRARRRLRHAPELSSAFCARRASGLILGAERSSARGRGVADFGSHSRPRSRFGPRVRLSRRRARCRLPARGVLFGLVHGYVVQVFDSTRSLPPSVAPRSRAQRVRAGWRALLLRRRARLPLHTTPVCPGGCESEVSIPSSVRSQRILLLLLPGPTDLCCYLGRGSLRRAAGPKSIAFVRRVLWAVRIRVTLSPLKFSPLKFSYDMLVSA